MDSGWSLTKIQDLSISDIEELLTIISKNIKVLPIDICAVGSRIRDDFRPDSDLDIVVWSDEIEGKLYPFSLKYEGVNLSVFQRNSQFINNDDIYGQFKLSKFSLITKQIIKGKDDDTFLEWKRKKFQNDNRRNIQ